MRTRSRPSCLLCGTPGARIYTGLNDRLYNAPGEWSLSKCTNAACELVWLDPMPVPEDLPLAYRTYYTHGDVSSACSALAPSSLKRYLRAVRRCPLAAIGVERE